MTNQAGRSSSSHPILGSFEPIEDLLYHDCPYVFTFRGAQDELAIAYLVAMDEQSSHYLAVVIDEMELTDVKTGAVSLRSVFSRWGLGHKAGRGGEHCLRDSKVDPGAGFRVAAF